MAGITERNSVIDVLVDGNSSIGSLGYSPILCCGVIKRFETRWCTEVGSIPTYSYLICGRGVKRNPIGIQSIGGGAVPSFRSNPTP